jgi:hypothetical protein
MSTAAGAQNAGISPPWCPATPSYPQQQQWRQEMNQAFHQQTFTPFLPPPAQYSSSPYGHPRTQYPASPYANYGGQHPPAMHYPQSMFGYPLHPPRLPPAIRTGHVDELLDLSCHDLYRGESTSHGTPHTRSQGLPPSATGRCPAWRPSQPAAMTANTPILSYERDQSMREPGGSNDGIQQSQQTYPSQPRPPASNQLPQLQQTPQPQPTRTGVIRHDGHTEVRNSRHHSVQMRRPNRSSSPRAASRRNFDHYSGDMTASSTSSDAEEAAARSPPANRIRYARREGRPHYHSPVLDPLVILNRQIKGLKDSLEKYTIGELPEVTSQTCDICAKDYSATTVQPSEDEELAVMLPCGHVFGEFCIDQWVRKSNLMMSVS